MTKKRQQLTLFMGENKSAIIETIRKEFNPFQYALIKSHVTLCREDEIEGIEKIKLNLAALNQSYITINFGHILRFADGKGVLLPAIGENKTFQALRATILQGIIEKPRQHEPHITLIHPRNATCTDEIFETIEKYRFPNTIEFKKISLIEQEMGREWRILEEFDLKMTH